jgi:hypothetical protein
MKILALLVVSLLATVSPVRAQATSEDEPDIYYDIFTRDTCLSVWIDLSSLINARVRDRLRDGVDVAIECRLELNSPRWLWADRLEADQTRNVRLSFRKVTDDYILDAGDGDSARTYTSSEAMERYLSDSVEVCVTPLARLDPDRTLQVRIRITSIFLTDLNLADHLESGDGSESPVKYLFRQFLELTDYGRRRFDLRSRPFHLKELSRQP